ncbi:class I SAM-dependent methyltransferase [Geminisphaera colitermitum]|uniref:class I SAM-dependent methyltransferase n=1 Tax=Geminisphaera colitermitum TaxID=1148786 RepID=UPI000158D4E5|nr:class I SAM-dependent methyltransferase [Geminisphaera colitermitum]
MNPPVEIWERRYADALHTPAAPRNVKLTPWLAPWLEDAFQPNPAESPTPPSPLRALDLGCGAGHDTAYLLTRGYDVTALDHSANALELSRRRNPAARHLRADLRDLDQVLPLPPPPPASAFYDAAAVGWHLIVASLSLHYFTREDTLKIFAAIHARLRSGGLFAFRLNAYDERGAPPDPTSWELTTEGDDAVPRQYFTEDKIRDALAGRYAILSLRKQTVRRYDADKSLYEVIALKPEIAS